MTILQLSHEKFIEQKTSIPIFLEFLFCILYLDYNQHYLKYVHNAYNVKKLILFAF